MLRSLFLDLVGRPPFAAERERWLGRGGHELIEALVGSPEFWEHWYEEQLYYLLLVDNFRPETEGARELPGKLAEGRLHARDALHRLALSPSFDLRNPGADTFVTVVLEQLTGMEVQQNARELEIGKALYDGGEGVFLGARGANQSDVVRIAIESDRAARHFLEREHVRLVGVPPERRALAGWARTFGRDAARYPEIVREWLLSDAYAARLERGAPLPNRLFVTALFVDLTDRLPGAAEVEPLRNALDGLSDARPLRSVLVRLLLDGGVAELPGKGEVGDPATWIGGLFERLLGRAATREELAAFTAAFRDPACRPETVLTALLSHPDYHRY